MIIKVEMEQRPDFDRALEHAIKQFKERETPEKEYDGNGELYDRRVVLVEMRIDDNYRRREYVYVFDIEEK